MPVQHLYLDGFPEKHKVEEVDVVTLYHEGRFDELNKVIICKNDLGKVTATFGDSDWHCLPFARNKANWFNYLNFSYLDNHPELQRELKLFLYGWLFNKNPQGRKASKFSTVRSRLTNIQRCYDYLLERGRSSIADLSKPSEWSRFESYLVEKNYAQASMKHSFIAINSVIKDSSWHKIEHGFSAQIKSIALAANLNSIEHQQTFTIPERLCDVIYGK